MDLVNPDFQSHALAHSREMRSGIKGLLDEAVEAGELLRCDTDSLARAVQAIMGGSLLQWAIDREGKAADRLIEDLSAGCEEGLNTRQVASLEDGKSHSQRDLKLET